MTEILDYIGLPALLEQQAEECSELAQASLKLARYIRGENMPAKTLMELTGNLLEEIADLDNILTLVAQTDLYDGPRIARIRENKMARWAQRIEAGRQQAEEGEKE